ncbi:MAG TPA: STAS domain-containing protein [Streptosporangiaceae bacterium]|nr:STAS domain-containing protein [Streptosporangiaceae bacterium]
MENRQMTAAAATPSIIALPAEIDAINSSSVAADLADACVPGTSVLVADLSSTTFADSSALRVLVRTDQFAASMGIEFRLVVTSAAVLRALELTGLRDVLRLYSSLDDAVGG